MKKKFDKDAVRFSVLVHDADTLSLINELAAKFKNRNAVLNDILNIGAPIYYARVFGKDVKSEQAKREHNPSVGRELKALRKDLDDLFVGFSIVETLAAGIFNVLLMQLDGEEVNAEALRDGSLCDLPELVAEIKADLIGHKGAGNGQ